MEAPRTPKTGAGERSSGPGPEGPRVEPVKPEGRRSSLGGGEDPERRERYESLMEQVVSADNYGAALGAVLRNRGAPGMDGMKTTELEGHLQKHWPRIRGKLLDGTYAVTPVRRVEIPKPNGGVRCLGIPTVLDRFIQQLLLQELGRIFEPGFSEHSYGFRPGRSTHDAVRAAREYVVRGGRDWVVDLDIEKFFDRVHHDIMMRRIGAVIRDKRVLKLIGRYLRSGVLVEGVVVGAREGTPQGGPLSPLLANLYLDPLDKELERRGYCFVRYADDCNVYVGGATAADRVVRNLPQWIAKHLRLKVNARKTGVGRPWEAEVPGVPDHPEGADRSGPGEPEAAEVTGAPTLGRPTEPQQPGTERPMAAAHPRLVGILPAGGMAASGLEVGRLDPAPHAQMLLVALAWLARASPATAVSGGA